MLAKLAGYAGTAILDNLPKVVNSVGSLLTHNNKIILEIDNQSDFTLTLYEGYHASGRYETAPDGTVYPNTASVYSSESRDGSFLTGAIGSVVYAIGNGDKYLAIYYSCPSIGGYKANAAIFPALLPHNAKTWYNILENGYTESANSKKNCGLMVSYSAGEQSTFTLTHA